MRCGSFLNEQNKDNKSRPGFVLVVVLAVLVFVSLVCYRYADQMALEREAASLAVRDVQARLWAKSGVEVAMAMMADPSFDVTTVYDDMALFAQQGVKSSDGSGPVGAFSIVVGEDVVTAQPLRYGFDSEGGKVNLNALVQSELSDDDQRNILLSLPNMTETLADTILDYLDSDAQARSFGTETDEEGYLIKNGPITSLDDLLNIPGVTLDLLYGEDVNQNRILDINEDDGDVRWPTDNGDGVLGYGWDHYLTLWSAESNLRADGAAKINLNSDDLTQLKTDLEGEFSADVVDFIIAYRLYGPASTSSSQSGSGTGTGSSSGGSSSGGSGSGSSSGGSSGGSSRGGSSSGGSSSGGSRTGSSSGGSSSGGSRSGGSSSGGSSAGVGTVTAQDAGNGGTTTSATSTGGSSSGGGSSRGGSSSSGVNTITGSSSSSGVNVINSQDTSGAAQTTSGGGSSNSTNSGSSSSGGLDTTQSPQFQLTSIYELFDSTVNYTDGENQVTLTSPWVSTDLSVLEQVDEALGISDQSSLAGRIDLNYATREVLTGLPDITTAMVDGILAKQGDWLYTGELMREGLVTVEQMRMLDQFITTGSKTFRLQSIGYPETGTQSVRVEAIIDASSGTPALIWLRDLSMLGQAYEEVVIKPVTTDSGTASTLSN